MCLCVYTFVHACVCKSKLESDRQAVGEAEENFTNGVMDCLIAEADFNSEKQM